MAAREKEGKKAWERRRAEAWKRRRWKNLGRRCQKRGGGEGRKKRQLFVRSGRGSGDHVNFF
jgi:hypothetical protein